MCVFEGGVYIILALQYELLIPSSNIKLHYTITETEMLSFWWNFNHWLHRKLSFWQLSVQPVMKISSKWRHFCFSDDVRCLHPWKCYAMKASCALQVIIITIIITIAFHYHRNNTGVGYTTEQKCICSFSLFSSWCVSQIWPLTPAENHLTDDDNISAGFHLKQRTLGSIIN